MIDNTATRSRTSRISSVHGPRSATRTRSSTTPARHLARRSGSERAPVLSRDAGRRAAAHGRGTRARGQPAGSRRTSASRSMPRLQRPARRRRSARNLPQGSRVFAGQRDEGFYVDLGVVRPAWLPPASTDSARSIDSLAGFNVNTIAIELPNRRVAQRTSGQPGRSERVIGVWSTASRLEHHDSTAAARRTAALVQVSRLGNPLVNEVVDPRDARTRSTD